MGAGLVALLGGWGRPGPSFNMVPPCLNSRSSTPPSSLACSSALHPVVVLLMTVMLDFMALKGHHREGYEQGWVS